MCYNKLKYNSLLFKIRTLLKISSLSVLSQPGQTARMESSVFIPFPIYKYLSVRERNGSSNTAWTGKKKNYFFQCRPAASEMDQYELPKPVLRAAKMHIILLMSK